jgi:hypothetical protein
MIITIGFLLLIVAGVSIVLREKSPENTELEWEGYLNRKLESTERLLGSAARSFSRSGAVARLAHSERTPESVRRDLELGGAFSGNLRVFYSMQLAALVTGASLLALSFLEDLGGFYRFMLVGVGLIVAYWPLNKIKTAASRKRETIIEELPEFADLLLMVLSSMSILQALNFTAERSKGSVATEMKELVRTISGRAMAEEQAFALTAGRLGTAEGREFVSALQSSYLDGTTAVENIRSQVENLQNLRYQHQRGKAKRLPVSLVVTFAMHFLPLLFVLAFLPVIASLSGMS